LACALALMLALPAEARTSKKLDQKQQAARAAFVAATQAYNLGQFEVALKHYEEAYAFKQHLGFLFNIAQCHRQLGHYEPAIFYYRRYLTEGRLDRDNQAVVRGLIREMEKKRADQEQQRRAEVEAAREKEIELARAAALKAEAEAAEKRRAEAVENLRVEAALKGLGDRSPPPEQPEPLYKKWWLWAGIGALATGAVIYVAIPVHPRSTTMGSISAR
jgi:tetratricopeptide (TPR) repeat protein